MKQFVSALRRFAEVVTSLEAQPEDILLLRIYVTDMQAYHDGAREFGGEYKTILAGRYPATTLVQVAGLDGVVSSPQEARAIRRACGPKFLIVVPGVRPSGDSAQDQSRVATPSEAMRAGADYLVVGRPITAAKNPREAALAINQEIAAALRISH